MGKAGGFSVSTNFAHADVFLLENTQVKSLDSYKTHWVECRLRGTSSFYHTGLKRWVWTSERPGSYTWVTCPKVTPERDSSQTEWPWAPHWEITLGTVLSSCWQYILWSYLENHPQTWIPFNVSDQSNMTTRKNETSQKGTSHRLPPLPRASLHSSGDLSQNHYVKGKDAKLFEMKICL